MTKEEFTRKWKHMLSLVNRDKRVAEMLLDLDSVIKYHISELLKLNKSDVISSVCDCKRLENGKIVMCQKCLVDLTEIE